MSTISSLGRLPESPVARSSISLCRIQHKPDVSWRGVVCCIVGCLAVTWCGSEACAAAQEPVANPPAALTAERLQLGQPELTDNPLDSGEALLLRVPITPAGSFGEALPPRLAVYRAAEGGAMQPIQLISLPQELTSEPLRVVIDQCVTGTPYLVRVQLVDAIEDDRVLTTSPVLGPVTPQQQWFDGQKTRLLITVVLLFSAVMIFIVLARRGMRMTMRRIAGLDAIEEAIGRATEMGRPCLFIPGIQDMNDIQTIAGVTILGHVARTAAEFDIPLEVPTTRSLVMTAARETVQGACLAAGRPDAFNPDSIYYVTDEQFGYVAYINGMMVRERPAACFYMGSFFAESLLLAESGNAVGAIQISGTAQAHQLPFFVAACDYTLIGEELFAASAYLSGSPEELGSLKGQDAGKLLVAVCLLVGCLLAQFWPAAAEAIFGK